MTAELHLFRFEHRLALVHPVPRVRSLAEAWADFDAWHRTHGFDELGLDEDEDLFAGAHRSEVDTPLSFE